MEPTYCVVFQGELAPGYELSAVKQSAIDRLKAPAAMVEQMFSARRVILKKGVNLDTGSRYLQELENIGMKARLEQEEGKSLPAASPATETTNQSASTDSTSSPNQLDEPDPLDAPVQDLGAYSPRTESAPEPEFGSPNQALTPLSAMAGTEETVFIPRKGSSATPSGEIEKASFVPHPAMPGMEARLPEMPPVDATIIVPRLPEGMNVIQGLPSEQTIVVPRRAGEAAMPNPGLAGSEATMIVPRPDMRPTLPSHGTADPTIVVPKARPAAPSTDNEATVFVPRKPEKAQEPGFDAERSLIASAETLAQYFSATSAATTDDPALLDESGQLASIKEPVVRSNQGSSDKTEIVNAYPSHSPAQRKPISMPIPRKGSSDTTVFVPPPRRGSCDPTVMAPLDESLANEADYFEETGMPKRSSKLIFALLLLALLGAGAYYYFAMH